MLVSFFLVLLSVSFFFCWLQILCNPTSSSPSDHPSPSLSSTISNILICLFPFMCDFMFGDEARAVRATLNSSADRWIVWVRWKKGGGSLAFQLFEAADSQQIWSPDERLRWLFMSMCAVCVETYAPELSRVACWTPFPVPVTGSEQFWYYGGISLAVK